MDAQGPDAEDFDVRLRWPADDLRAEPEQAAASSTDPFDDAIAAASDTAPAPEVAVDGAGADDAARDVPPVPLLPAMAGRLESVHSALATLSMRLDALVTATAAFRSVVSDRLNDYADTVARLHRVQAAELEDYRHGTERLVAELRRAMGDNDEALRKLTSRVEEIGIELGAFNEAVRATIADSRATSSAAEKLSLQVAEGLDAFGERMIDRLDESQGAAESAIAAAGGEMTKLRRELAALRKAPRAEVADGRAAGAGVGVGEELAAIREELSQLRRRIGVRAKTTSAASTPAAPAPAPAKLVLDDEQLARIVDAVGNRIGRLAPTFTPKQLDAIVTGVVAQLEQSLELVDDAPPARPSAPRTRR
jgi:hypothetical protein